jgi:hypothetical protein
MGKHSTKDIQNTAALNLGHLPMVRGHHVNLEQSLILYNMSNDYSGTTW